MRKMYCVVAMIIAVMMVGNVWAFNWQDHVKVAPNGKGDALIYPVYAAFNGGWETKLWVTNTAVDRSVVAKVVFRSMKNSDELLDFLIYLTPTDVWTGIIRYNNNRVEIYSTDDSALSAPNVWASTTPLQQPLGTPNCSDDNNMMGYVEIFEAAHTAYGAVYPEVGGTTNINLNTPPVSKSALYNVYNKAMGGDATAQALIPAEGINVLSGHLELRNTALGHSTIVPATILRDYDTTLNTPTSYLNISNETFWGNGESWNTTGEVEAALSKNDLAMPYFSTNLTLHVLTFPTKMTNTSAAKTSSGACDYSKVTLTKGTGTTTASPYFTNNATSPPASGSGITTAYCIAYTGTDFDLTEKSKASSSIFSPAQAANNLCAEVNYVNTFAFSEGWTRYLFKGTKSSADAMVTPFDFRDTTAANGSVASGADGQFYGAPVIGTVIHLGALDTTNGAGFTSVGASYTDGLVLAPGTETAIAAATAGGVCTGTPCTFQTTGNMLLNNPAAFNDDVYHFYYQYQDRLNIPSGLSTHTMGTSIVTFQPYGIDMPANAAGGTLPIVVEDQDRNSLFGLSTINAVPGNDDNQPLRQTP